MWEGLDTNTQGNEMRTGKQIQLTGYISTAKTLHRSLLMFTLVYIKSLNVMMEVWKTSGKTCTENLWPDISQKTNVTHEYTTERVNGPHLKKSWNNVPLWKGHEISSNGHSKLTHAFFLAAFTFAVQFKDGTTRCEWKSIHFYGSQTIIQINTENLLEIELKCPLAFSS